MLEGVSQSGKLYISHLGMESQELIQAFCFSLILV